MNQRLKVKKGMIQLERELNITIGEYYFHDNYVVFLVNTKDWRKLIKNKSIIKKLSKKIGKYLTYIYFPCGTKGAARQCVFPVKIEDILIERNNGKTILIYLVDQFTKNFIMNKYGSKFKLSEILLQKHFSIDNIKIRGINLLYYDYHERLLVPIFKQ